MKTKNMFQVIYSRDTKSMTSIYLKPSPVTFTRYATFSYTLSKYLSSQRYAYDLTESIFSV